MKKESSQSDIIIGLLALVSTGAFYPAFWTASFVGNASFLIFSFTLFLWAFFLFLFKRRIKYLSRNYNLLYLVLFSYYTLRLCFTLDGEDIIKIIQLSVFYFYTVLCYNSFSDKAIAPKYFIYFNILMIFLTIVGTIFYYMGLIGPVRFISMGENSNATLADYGFFYIKSHTFEFMDVGRFIRPAGYYDEPGSFGLVLLLLLIYNKKILKNKIVEIIMLFGGLVTISLAYIYSAIVYMFLFFLNKKNIIYVILVAIALISLIPKASVDDATYLGYFFKQTVERTENVQSGTDNSRNYDASKKAFLSHPFFGATTETLDMEFPDSTHETIWYFMAQNGIVGTIILYIPFIYLFFRKKSTLDDKKLLLLIGLMLIQRPHYLAPLYLTIIYFTFFQDTSPSVNLHNKGKAF